MARNLRWIGLIFILCLFLAQSAGAATFRYASQGDPRTMDPHAMNEQLTLMVQHQIYDPLVGRDKDLKLVPSLATKWEFRSGQTWRFWLRVRRMSAAW